MKTQEINQAVCQSRENTTVVKFLNENQLSSEIVEMINEGQIWGVYYKDGELVAEDIWGDIHTNVLK